MSLSSLTDLLAGGGKSAKFENPGDTIAGTVIKAEVRQKTDPDTSKPEFWDDGRAVEQIVVTLSTELRDPDDPQDDGHRNVYIKGWGDQLKALKAAIKASGAKDIQPGGRFVAQLTGKGERAKPHLSPPNIFAYAYTPPAAAAVSNLLAEPAATPVQQPQAPAALPTPGNPFANLTPEQIAALAALQQAQQKPPF